MIDDLDTLAALLADTPLQGAALQLRWDSAWERPMMLLEPGTTDPQDAWQVLRELVPRSGRYPMVASRDELDIWLTDEAPEHPEEWAINEVQRLMDEAAHGNLDHVADSDKFTDDAARSAHLSPDHPGQAFFLETTRRHFGSAPTVQEFKAAFEGQPPPRQHQLERWLLDWEISHFGDRALQPTRTDHGDWHWPSGPLVLLLAPEAEMWRAAASVPIYGGGWPDMYVGLRLWHERYGAELVMAEGTLRFLRVQRRPTSAEEAFDLALQHYVIARDSLILSGVSLRDHARFLLHSDRWKLWDRP